MRFTVILPGVVDTDILDNRPEPPTREMRDQMLHAEDVAAAFARARAAQNEWSPQRARARRRAVSAAAEALAAAKDEVVDLMVREVGKPLDRVLTRSTAARCGSCATRRNRRWTPTGTPFPRRRPGTCDTAVQAPPPARRRGADHALELPVRDPALEGRAGARLRQRRRAQARLGRDRLRAAAAGDPRQAPARGRLQRRHRPGRRRPGRGRAGRRRVLHGLDRRRTGRRRRPRPRAASPARPRWAG